MTSAEPKQNPPEAQTALDQLKQRMRGTWMAGDFGQIARYAAKGAEEFVDRLSISPGMRVLDVACGTGNSRATTRFLRDRSSNSSANISVPPKPRSQDSTPQDSRPLPGTPLARTQPS